MSSTVSQPSCGALICYPCRSDSTAWDLSLRVRRRGDRSESRRPRSLCMDLSRQERACLVFGKRRTGCRTHQGRHCSMTHTRNGRGKSAPRSATWSIAHLPCERNQRVMYVLVWVQSQSARAARTSLHVTPHEWTCTTVRTCTTSKNLPGPGSTNTQR